MKWQKKGLIWSPDGSLPWARHSALQPTAVAMGDFIRVFFGVRDDEGVGRPAYVDVAADDPSRVLKVADRPLLDVGEPGTFDDNGVVPCAVIRRDGQLLMHYAGYQLGVKVKFLAFGGLAISDDGGESFDRYSQVPVLERTSEELYFKAAHCVLWDEGVWKIWYTGGSAFTEKDGLSFPVYDTRYVESSDGIHPNGKGEVCLMPQGGDEYRLGRGHVIKTDGLYRMIYARGTKSAGMQLGYAESTDGRVWTRKDEEVGLRLSDAGWDSRHISYPNFCRVGDRVYLFYNGNDYGKTGFGYAELESWS